MNYFHSDTFIRRVVVGIAPNLLVYTSSNVTDNNDEYLWIDSAFFTVTRYCLHDTEDRIVSNNVKIFMRSFL